MADCTDLRPDGNPERFKERLEKLLRHRGVEEAE
jgi:hypothetical protein